MLSWITSLFVLFMHGNSASATPASPTHSSGPTTIHAMDSGSSTADSGSSPIVDGQSIP
jgi:hypothetical protein